MSLRKNIRKLSKLVLFDNSWLEREVKKLLRKTDRKREQFFANERYFV